MRAREERRENILSAAGLGDALEDVMSATRIRLLCYEEIVPHSPSDPISVRELSPECRQVSLKIRDLKS